MVHTRKFTYEQDYRDLLRELNKQKKMNIKFIKDLPLTQKEVFKELGADITVAGFVGEAGSGIVNGVGDEPKLPKNHDVVFIR